jgi:hypothetical protein
MLLVYWVLERPFVVRWFDKAEDWFEYHLGLAMSTVKRAVALVLSAALAVGLWCIYASLGYADFPVGFEAWVNLIITVSTITFTGSQVLHIAQLQRQRVV